MNIKDCIHFYIGCRVLIDDKEYGTLKGGTFVPNSVDQIYYDIQTDEMKENEDEDFDMPYNDDTSEDCRIKPLLRRLEDMDAFEAIELARLQTDRKRHDSIDIFRIEKDHVHYMDGSKWFGDGVEEYNDLYVYFQALQPDQFHYLLKQGFDLWGLIDAGLAVDAKTVQK